MNKLLLGGTLVVLLGVGGLGVAHFSNANAAVSSSGVTQAARNSQSNSVSTETQGELSFTDMQGRRITVNRNDKTFFTLWRLRVRLVCQRKRH